jgi:DNA replication and repair protein RecF
MRIDYLKLYNFRNYHRQKISFGSAVNVLAGHNGQGKTNVLESVFFLLTGKSHRIRREKEMIAWGEKLLYLNGDFTARNRRFQIESVCREERRAVCLNGVPCHRMSDYVGSVNVVFFTPDDLNIIKRSPQERRRFIDILICQSKPAHISALNQYNRAVRQKSALLRNLRGDNPETRALLRSWNDQMAEAGKMIIGNRAEYAAKLQKECRNIYSVIFAAEQRVDLIYFSLGRKVSPGQIPDLNDFLAERLTQEIERKTVLVGPHRDDILIDINAKPARDFASQGQQRALVLSIKLAEMEIYKNEKEEYPILLLDDVLSELDKKRRGFLLNYITAPNMQTLITMTERNEKISGADTVFYRIEAGQAHKE